MGVVDLPGSGLKRSYARHLRRVVLVERDVADAATAPRAVKAVTDKDLPSAIEFQMEGLHPYPEDDAVSSWVRIPDTASVLIAISASMAWTS